jgi:hypothetical protein
MGGGSGGRRSSRKPSCGNELGGQKLSNRGGTLKAELLDVFAAEDDKEPV